MNEPLDKLATLYGIAATWRDFRGETQPVSRDSCIAILRGLGVDTDSPQAALTAFEHARWQRLVPPAVVGTIGNAMPVPVTIEQGVAATQLAWTLTLETGERSTGVAQLAALALAEHGDAGERRVLPLVDLPLGYHRIVITLDTGATAESLLIVAPAACHQPAVVAAGQRVWGIAIQLYALRSADNWGMGDFRDLRELIERAAPLGCSLLGLNPLHALMPADPAHISPYSPSSRQFINVLYIAVVDVPEFAECASVRERVASEEFQAQLHKLRAAPNVDYPGVARTKFAVLRLLYEHFRETHLHTGSQRALAFRSYVHSRGQPLQMHALYDALDADLRRQDPQCQGWQRWPKEYRDPASATVRRFARERFVEVEFFLWLQWLAEEQLREAQQFARRSGMSIGLYGDVAVGASPGGSETWSHRRLYVDAACIGAPPDALALKGQDWGLPPPHPFELAREAYQPFIVMVRNAMRAVGALRFDHVMALFRLWWVPRGLTSAHGAYVHYPLDDLIAILALESVRHHCAVIGEDLGTVPDEVRAAMEQYQLNHYKVLLFEQADGAFKTPVQYPAHSLATATTHDLPTVRGWWESHDIELRERLNLYPDEGARNAVREARARERPALMAALVRADLWHWQPHESLPPWSSALARAIHVYLGLSNANFVMLQIEDLIGMIDPVNVPGTDQEHANWQRKVTQNTMDILARAEVRDVLAAMQRARRGENPNG